MASDLTPETLAELKALHAKATPGEWVSCENGSVGTGHIHMDQDENTGQVFAVAAQFHVAGTDNPDNRDFIAAAHNHFPALLRAAEDAERMRAALTIIAFPRRGTPEEVMTVDQIGELAARALKGTP